MEIARGFLSTGDIEFAAARCAGTDEDRVVVFAEQLLQAVDAMAALEFDAEVEDVVGLLVDNGVRWAELRNLPPRHPARLGSGIESGAVIAERREVARDGDRGGTATDQ